MFPPILTTKLFFPPPRPDLLPRARLIEQLNDGASRQLTLISASAGFGKTTLLSQWIASTEQSVAWLSLDDSDNDGLRFFTYLILALQQIRKALGADVLAMLHSASSSDYEVLLCNLINEIAKIDEHFTLILDDYHAIIDPQIHHWLAFMLENLPEPLHLMVATRIDPPWPLARLRARRELLEIRSRDLRFTSEETAALLTNVVGLKLTSAEVHSLDERVEGWGAGLQLAVLSMQGRDDLSHSIETFTGSNRFILDYLMDEVLDRQTAEIRDFLLKTSILERLNASLCNALLDKVDSQEILTRLEQSNIFLIPLDDERIWFRYHHLFADLLQNHLMRLYPKHVSDLHTRASHWYDSEGLFTEAIDHALNGEDLDRAANLYKKYGLAVMSISQDKNLSSWFDLLPAAVIRNRPWLCILLAWLNYSIGSRAKAEEFLQMVEQLIEQPPSEPETHLTNHSFSVAERQRLIGAIASIRAHISIVERDFQAVLEQVNLAFDNLPDEDTWRITAMVAQGCAYWALGDRYQSEKTFANTSNAYLKKGNWDGFVSSKCYMGLMQLKQGNLQSALGTYEEALSRATKPDGMKVLFASIPFLRIGDLMREWNELARAQDFINNGISFATKLNHPDVLIEAYICLARLQFSLKNQKGVISALSHAEQIMTDNKVDPWYLGWLDECWLRYWLSIGDVAAAASRVERNGLTTDSPLSYHHDLHHINLVRVLIAQGERDPSGLYLNQAETLLNRLQEAAEKADWVHETIKILILKGLLFWISEKNERSVAALTQGLTLAEPGGYVRLFVDEGAPMEKLLSFLLAPKDGERAMDLQVRVYAEKLLQALNDEKGGMLPDGSSGLQNLVEPLSERELEILQYLTTHFSSTDIGRELHISANTVRFHIKNIYSKLGVHNRADAVQLAHFLGLM